MVYNRRSIGRVTRRGILLKGCSFFVLVVIRRELRDGEFAVYRGVVPTMRGFDFSMMYDAEADTLWARMVLLCAGVSSLCACTDPLCAAPTTLCAWAQPLCADTAILCARTDLYARRRTTFARGLTSMRGGRLSLRGDALPMRAS